MKGISLKGNVVALSKSALGTDKVTISGNYKLALGKDITKSKTTTAGFIVKGTTATYKTKTISAGYTLASNGKSISYTKASGGKTLVTLTGLKSEISAKKLSLKNKTVTLSAGTVGSKGASVKGGGYNFALSSAGKLINIGTAASLTGSSGKDTLIGGKGNDTLAGGKGNDIFVYSAGNDVITDYTAGDQIKISGKISKTNYSGNDVIFTIGKGTLTVKEGNDKKISINGKTKTYGKSTSKNVSTLWFADDTNFTTSDDLVSIMKNNLTSTDFKMDTTNFDTLAREDSILAYSSKHD